MNTENLREWKKTRRFLRLICALILTNYTAFVSYKLWFEGVELSAVDYSIIGGCVAGLVAIESVRAYVKRKYDTN